MNESLPKAKPTNLIQTIERVADILDALAQYPGGMSLGELSENVQLPKGTTHRFLSSLIYFGFVRQETTTKHYSLGFKLVELGNRLLNQLDLREEARPFLVDLAQRIKETVHLVILDQQEIVYIDKLDAVNHDVGFRMTSRVGLRVPAHACASGKILLAHLSEEDLKQFIATKELKKITENTISDPEILKEQLKKIRAQGFALDEQEREKGVRCVAAPIRNESGKVVAAISISGTTVHLTKKIIENELRKEVVATALAISRKLGFRG
ncbi:transcriptional regulator, IclR family [Candidatus Vecturithrix granuli]|uniref:Transcriptional regulator, IclR family n=1 Tax=Vecturithrix granuli TaxID=1499967 RepID=A0A081C7Q4_VECG1|nr:transcriptional regulator, IclR family [Candidatus Vecturithrix granuli]